MDYNNKQAENETKDFIKKHHINIIEPNFDNDILLKDMKKDCKLHNIEFHIPDCWIIADFKKNGINKVYSTNNHFLDACRLFGMDASKFPTFEKELEKKLKEMFNYKR